MFDTAVGPGQANLSELFTSYGNSSSVRFPNFDGMGGSFAENEEAVELWNRITTLDTTKRGPALVPQVAPRAEGLCMAMVTPKLIAVDGVKDVMKELCRAGCS